MKLWATTAAVLALGGIAHAQNMDSSRIVGAAVLEDTTGILTSRIVAFAVLLQRTGSVQTYITGEASFPPSVTTEDRCAFTQPTRS